MVQKLEAIRGGGGSIKVGATGTIGSLITREIESMRCKKGPPIVPVPTPAVVITPNRLRPVRTSSETTKDSNAQKRTPKLGKPTHQIPMLSSTDISIDRTPCRKKVEKKGAAHIVQVVDVRCGHPDKAWVNPLANRFKKLTFSKLSETIG
ncbi:hypothetical protein ACHQM5_008422 [Ranunculus cassubicifolius]